MSIGIIVDLIIVVFILLSAFLGYRKGLIKLGAGFVAFIIAIVATVILYRPIANLVINVTSIDEMLENTIISKVDEIITQNEDEGLTSQLIESAKNGMLPSAARQMAINIVYAGGLIILFVGIRIALKFITALADAISKLPILNQFNKAGGIIYGLLRGVIVIYALLIIVAMIGEVNPKNSINQAVNETYIAKTMYENNIFNVLFKNCY